MYRIISGIIMLSIVAFSENVLITGVVFDDVGKPISQAKVEFEGTKLYSYTNDTGYFKIEGASNRKANPYRIKKEYKHPTFQNNKYEFTVYNKNTDIIISLYNLKGRLLNKSIIANLCIGNYQYPLSEILYSNLANGFYLVKIAIGKNNYIFKVLCANQKVIGSKKIYDESVTTFSNSEALYKSNFAQHAGILKVTKTGYFIQKMPINSYNSNIGKIHINRAKKGQKPVEFKLQIALDSMFTDPIFVSPAINDLNMEDTISKDVRNIQSWQIDTSVIAGLKPDTRIWIKIDSSQYHPEDETITFISGFLLESNTVSLVSDYSDVKTSDFSITTSFTINDFIPLEKGLKKKSEGIVFLGAIVLLISKYRSYRDDKAEAKFHTELKNHHVNKLNKNAIVFVHGLGSSEVIWLENGYSTVAKNMGYDVWTVNYPYSRKYHISSHGIAVYEKIIAETTPRSFSDYDSIYFVCHSMGGLVSRKALSVGEKTFLGSKTKEIILYSSPSDGGRISLKKTKWGKFIEFDANKLSPFSVAGSLTGFMGIMDLMHGYMNEEDWKRIGIAYTKNKKSSCKLPDAVRPYATIVTNDEFVSEASGFDRVEPNDLKLKNTVPYVKGNDYRNENAVLQLDGNGLLHSSSYVSAAGKDLFQQWISCDCPPIVVDADSNVYTTVKIGNQCWTVENLKTTKYNDGKSIPNVTVGDYWITLNSGAYCYYNNDISYENKYGALYNWHAVGTGKLAPEGWHVPTDTDWEALENYMIKNGYNCDGSTKGNKIAKAMSSQTDWELSDKSGAIGNDLNKNNISGFSAFPGGFHTGVSVGVFGRIGENCSWWSSTEQDELNASFCRLLYSDEDFYKHHNNKRTGFSVRLIKDNILQSD